MPVEHEVISITPNWQILTFSSAQKARNILLEKYHHFIIESPDALARRYSTEQIQHIMRGYGLKIDLFPEERFSLANIIWPQFIIFGRRTTITVFNNKDKTKKPENHYYLNYTPRRDLAKDLAYLALPRQAKKLVDLAVKLIPESGWPEHKWYKAIMESKEELNTRQSPWKIWTYYRQQIFNLGFMTPLE